MKRSIVFLALFMGGCSSTQMLTTKEQIVILPSASMYNCPTLESFPKPDSLTDIQVAFLIVQLHKNNKICKNSIDSIKRYLEESKTTLEKKR
jgi:hypothetical protein